MMSRETLAALAMSVLCFAGAAAPLYWRWCASHWRQASARIVGHRIYERSAPAWQSIGLDVQYVFRLDNTEYYGDRVSPRGPALFATPAGAREFAQEAYPMHSVQSVWYDPSDPERSMLTRHLDYGSLLFLAVGLFLLGAALAQETLARLPRSAAACRVAANSRRQERVQVLPSLPDA